MKCIEVLEPQPHFKESKIGRPQVLTEEKLLNAIQSYATKSPTELAKRIGVSRRTIYRYLENIPDGKIDEIFHELAEEELKPYETTLDVWKELPKIKRYRKLLLKSQTSKKYMNRMIREFWHISVYLNKKPSWFNRDHLDEIADLVLDVREGNARIKGLSNEYRMRMTLRSFLMKVQEIAGETLTVKGISGSMEDSFGKRAKDRLTRKQRHAFIEALKTITKDDMELQARLVSLAYWLYYTGTRIEASLKVKIEDINRNGEIWKVEVIDKGLHRKGRTKWVKLIAGELKQQIQCNLQARDDPEDDPLFSIGYEKARRLFREAYERAGIKVHQPFHIWRHTGAQDLLRATGWNYDFVAEILGWKNTDTLKRYYGAMGETIRERVLMKAMGRPIDIPKTKFEF